MTRRFIVSLLLLLGAGPAPAQNRLADGNAIAWFNGFGTFYLSPKVSLYAEYQWRREGLVQNWQQSLARGGLQYHFNKDVSVLLGYGYVITFPYGDYQVGPHTFPEHRLFEQLTWNDPHGRFSLNHRLRLEQRFLGQVDQMADEREVQRYNYMNRARYQLRGQYALNHRSMTDQTWYAAAFDEVFIGFGPNVNQNIFDQNRIGLLLGYQFNQALRLEGGYFSQILQQPAAVQGKEVMQYNNGLIVNFYVTQ